MIVMPRLDNNGYIEIVKRHGLNPAILKQILKGYLGGKNRKNICDVTGLAPSTVGKYLFVFFTWSDYADIEIFILEECK